MVQAILDGRKTQTRRICKPQPIIDEESGYIFIGNTLFDIHDGDWQIPMYLKDIARWDIGDVLWVRETWNTLTAYEEKPDHSVMSVREFVYKADDDRFDKWKPSIFMPKEACRIRLLVEDVRVERLQDISEEDAIAEGIERKGEFFKSYQKIHRGPHKGEEHPWNVFPNASPKTSYYELWESINGEGSWDKNPWVWVIEFTKL